MAVCGLLSTIHPIGRVSAVYARPSARNNAPTFDGVRWNGGDVIFISRVGSAADHAAYAATVAARIRKSSRLKIEYEETVEVSHSLSLSLATAGHGTQHRGTGQKD